MEHKSNVRVVEMSACLVWLRDLGPSFVVREGDTRLRREIAGVDWQYNAYGGYNGLFGPEDHQLNRRKELQFTCYCTLILELWQLMGNMY